MRRKTQPNKEKVGVVIVSAGNSMRMQGIDKQYLEIDGMAVVVRSVLAFDVCRDVDEIVIVCREDQIPQMMQYVRIYQFEKVTKIVKGAQTRQESVFSGVQCLSPETTMIAIHDGARPFVSQEVIHSCLRAAREFGACTAAVKVKDTIKVASQEGFIVRTPDRDTLYQVQTPQVFQAQLYRQAMEQAISDEQQYTDDCQLIEKMGHPVFLAEGDYRNIKITTPEDIPLAEAIAQT